MQIVGSNITFSLSFSDLSSTLSVAHIHFAPSQVAGGVMIFLCGGGGQPDCPWDHVRNHYRDDYDGKCYGTHNSGH
jgi:hypothetical protein